jgi:hypothetical protein
MKKTSIQILLILSLCMGVFTPAFAQDSSLSTPGPRKQMATIVFAGLGGAILGLSTLSFYGRPQDHLVNIAIGFAIGVIAGTAYTSYGAATNPNDFYGKGAALDLKSIENMQGPTNPMQVRAPEVSASIFEFQF